MNRRTFVSSLTTAASAAAVSPRLFASTAEEASRVGLIGCGWYGNVNLDILRKHGPVKVVSLCDPNVQAIRKTLEAVALYQSSAPATYSDFRRMLQEDPLDIVIVGTPDHWHALPALEAVKAGADVYLEKPISVDVMEGEALVAATRKYGRVVQVNLQRRSSKIAHEAKARYLDNGRLGKIGLVETFYYGNDRGALIPAEEPPSFLDYEMWCGPAPMVDYVPPIASRGWRMFMEYGNGHLGDMGVHMFDMVRMMLGLGWPESITSTGGILVHRKATSNRTDTQRTTFHYPHLDVSWEHRTWGKPPIPHRHWTDLWGARFIGENGTLTVTSLYYAYSPDGVTTTEGRHALSQTGELAHANYDDWQAYGMEMQMAHVEDFQAARAIRSRPVADILEGHISSACCILGNIALATGRRILYDPERHEVTGDPEATRLLSRPYRRNWIHPDPGKV